MRVFDTPADLLPLAGQTFGASDWLLVDQPMIDAFAEATGDHQWIHVDVERARAAMPEGRTIAHGYLIVSLIPRLAATIYGVTKRSRSINYGSDKVRFITPVTAGSSIRLRQTAKTIEPVEGGVRITMACIVEIDGKPRPAVIAETISIIYD